MKSRSKSNREWGQFSIVEGSIRIVIATATTLIEKKALRLPNTNHSVQRGMIPPFIPSIIAHTLTSNIRSF